MFWHIDTDVISLLVVTLICISSRELSENDVPTLRGRLFQGCLEVGIIITVVDIVASMAMELSVPRFLYHVLMTMYFVGIEFVIVIWFLYVLTLLYPVGSRTGRMIGASVICSYVIYALFTCLNPWTGMIYSLGPNNEYSRGPMFGTMLVLYGAYTLALFVLILIRWRHIPKAYPGVVLLTPVLTGAGIAVQLLVPGLLLIMPAYMLCLLMAFLFFQTQRLKSSQEQMESITRVAETDPLTGLFNRSGMEMMVQRTLEQSYGREVVVLITDIDDLKHINDHMGHAQGDRAIRLVAEQLRRHFRTGDTVVRYGGDEFLTFLTGALDRERMSQSLRWLEEELRTLRVGEDDGEALHASIGAAFGVVGEDSFQSLCNRADIALYHVKRHGKDGFAFYTDEMEREEHVLSQSPGE